MNQLQSQYDEDQDIINMRIEIDAALKKRELLKKERRRKRVFMQILSLLAVAVLLVIAALVIYFLHSAGNTTEDDEAAAVLNVDNVKAKTSSAFEKFYFYEANRADRYAAYSESNPDMSAEEVVWRVNSNLDMPWYEYDVPVSGYDDPYIIVNKYNTVADDYCPPDLVNADGYMMREETAKAYKEMKAAAAADGMKIRVVSAYRSVEYQDSLYKRYLSSDSRENVDKYSARPGHSEHHTGMAIDLFGSTDGLGNFKNTPEYPWVKENAYKYGFIIRYTANIENITGYEDEPWHIRYVGKEVSLDMKEKGIESFEEYHAKYIAHKQK